MKKNIICLIFAFIFLCGGCICNSNCVYADIRNSYMAIVIDDFGGYNRNGVEKMLSLDCSITCAVMPGCEYTLQDAEDANKNGHEVILHMPMEAHVDLPAEWYGNIYVKNSDTPKVAREKVEKCFSVIPYAKGLNIHIGSGVSKNKDIITEIMNAVKERNLFFCDSKTIQNSVCEQCALETKADFISRDEFLETTHNADYSYAKKMLIKGAQVALKNGHSVVIGHVGPEGGISTYNAIKDSLLEIQNMGVKIVPLSKVIEYKYGRSN